MPCSSPPAGDQKLIQIVDAALADSARRSGKWLACRSGCSHCCVGVFAINQLDAIRLRNGLAETEKKDPERAARIRKRVVDTVARLSPEYPGDPVTGLLDESDDEAACKQWDDFANDEPCPVLDPATGACDLYEFRPVMCRTFGPPLMSDGDLGVCDLCFDGATEAEIIVAEMKPDPDNFEATLLQDLEKTTGARGETIIAFALQVDAPK
jgi:Fe-S-cluster containining protein